ncbi:MAG: EAL domain-containing protein [Methylococcales bacterium]
MPNEVIHILGETAHLSSLGFGVVTTDGIITYANPAFCEMFLIATSETYVGQSLLEFPSISSNASFTELKLAFACPDSAAIQFHFDRDIDPLTLEIAELNAGSRMLVAKRGQKLLLESISFHQRDHLTGLGNRLLLDEILENWQPNSPEVSSLAVIMIDLDRFKKVIDALGHSAGDTLLKLVAQRIMSVAQEPDTVVRMGGDVFVVAHPIGLKSMSTEWVAKRIVELMNRPFLVDGQQVNISASIGIAALNHGTDTITDLLKHAEFALYKAKGTHQGAIRYFEPELAFQAMNRYSLEIDLRRALVLKEFILLYQPQVNMTDGSLQGFEALIRWQNPARGLISPLDFIPLTEDTGEIHAIGEWILHTACKEAMSWDGNFSVGVNVSPIQFESEGIVNIVSSVLATTGLPPERLELEITEGVLIKDFANVLKQLWALKSMGVGIAMDDFGTGYSSLSYLNSFPFSKIKIDQSFVRGESYPKSRALLQAIISLGGSLDIVTIAEGVETQDQYDQLAADGCLGAQGYLISVPMPTTSIRDFISDFKKKCG